MTATPPDITAKRLEHIEQECRAHRTVDSNDTLDLVAAVRARDAEIERLIAINAAEHDTSVELAAEIERARSEVAFFAERLEKQDGQYSHAHPAAARYRALREGLERRATIADARAKRLAELVRNYRGLLVSDYEGVDGMIGKSREELRRIDAALATDEREGGGDGHR